MKILFVNPYIHDFTAYDLWLRPLGLLYLAALVQKYTDCEVLWLDALDRYQGDRRKKVLDTGRGKYPREIIEKPPLYDVIPRSYARYGIPLQDFRDQIENLPDVDLVCLTSLMTYWGGGLAFTIDSLKKRFPGAGYMLGGVIPSLVPGEIVKKAFDVDHLVRGYGEKPLLDLISALGGNVFAHPDFSRVDNLPYPAVQYLGDRAALPLLTSRGCPFHCTYCASDRLNPGFLERAPERVAEEIFFMQENYGTRHFALFDDALLVNKKKRFFPLFRRVQERLNINFHTPNGLHVGEIDGETAEIFFNSGFTTLRLSMESTCGEILEKSSYKVTVEQMVRAVEHLERAGYRRHDIGVYLLFGLPGQKIEDVERALFFARDLGVTPHLSYFSPVPGTREFTKLQRQGVLSTPLEMLETNKIYFVYHKAGFSHDEVASIKNLSASIARRVQSNL